MSNYAEYRTKRRQDPEYREIEQWLKQSLAWRLDDWWFRLRMRFRAQFKSN